MDLVFSELSESSQNHPQDLNPCALFFIEEGVILGQDVCSCLGKLRTLVNAEMVPKRIKFSLCHRAFIFT